MATPPAPIPPPSNTWVGDLTLRQIAKRKGVLFNRNMTPAQLIRAMGEIIVILAQFFPILKVLLQILELINKVYETLVKLYRTLVKVLKALKKAIETAAGILTGTGAPKVTAQAQSEAQKKLVNEAKKQVTAAVKKIIDPILDKPIKEFATGLPSPSIA